MNNDQKVYLLNNFNRVCNKSALLISEKQTTLHRTCQIGFKNFHDRELEKI
jgi:hypothetical protein